MAYVIIPDGFTLKKVTKLEKQAVEAYFRHEDTKAILENENTPLVVGGLVAGYFAVQTSKSVIAALEEELGQVSQNVKDAVDAGVAKVEKELVTDPKNWFEKKLDIGRKRLEELDITRLA